MATKISHWRLQTNLYDLLTRATAGMEKVNKLTEKLTGAFNKATGGSQNLKNSIGELEEKLKGLETNRRAALSEADIRKFNGEIQKTEAQLNRLRNLPPDGLFARLQKGIGMSSLMTGALAAAFSVNTLVNFSREVVATTGKFERYGAVLQNTLGKAGATESLNTITQFAAKTPFAVDELTDSYLRLTNRGMKPSMEAMTNLGDLASSQGKGFLQLTEAVLDATTGEFERLKEFGLKGSKAGDQITLAFGRFHETVKATPEAVSALLQKIGRLPGVAGAMQSISATTEGLVSNMGDQWDMLMLKIGVGSKGAMGFLFEGTQKVLGVLNGFADWLRMNQGIVEGFFKVIALGAVVVGYFALSWLAATIAASPFIFAGIAIAAVLVYCYNRFEMVRGAIDALIVILEQGVRMLFSWWKTLWGILTLDFDLAKSGFTDFIETASETPEKAAKAFNQGVENAKLQKMQDPNKSVMDQMMEGIPGGGNTGSVDQGSLVGAGDGSGGSGNSSGPQATVNNINNADTGQKNIRIVIEQLIGIQTYNASKGERRTAGQAAGDGTLENLLRVLNTAQGKLANT